MLITPQYIFIKIHHLLDGRSEAVWFSDIIGHQIRKDTNLNNLRESRLEKIDTHIRDGLLEKDPSLLTKLPSILNNLPSPFEDFAVIHNIPLLQTLSRQIDAYSLALINAREHNSFERLKSVAFEAEILRDDIYWFTEDDKNLKEALGKCKTIEEAERVLNTISMHIFLSFLSALDIEFCSIAFGEKLQLHPLFLYLQLKANFAISHNNTKSPLPKTKRFFRPSRRLLELTHACFYYAKHNKWPENPAGQKDLQPISRVPNRISGYFDGTKNFNDKEYFMFTEDVEKHFQNTNKAYFFPLLFASKFWETLQVLQKSKDKKIQEAFIDDGKLYKKFWDFHKNRWANDLANGNDHWPEWLET